MIVLSGDVGGTNARLQLTKHVFTAPVCNSPSTSAEPRSSPETLFLKKYPAVEHSSLQEIIELFLQESGVDKTSIKAACIAVAGPVKNGEIEFTNLPWVLKEVELADFLGLRVEKVRLINDFVAIGYGVGTLDREKDLFVLQEGKPDTTNQWLHPIATIGAGTGLGFGIVTTGPDGQVGGVS